MYGELYSATEAARMRIDRAEKQARQNERYKEIRSKEQIWLTATLTSIIGLFLK